MAICHNIGNTEKTAIAHCFKGVVFMKSEEEVLVSLANDVSGFIIMCSEKDAEFLTNPHNDRNREEYMRVFTLAFAFGFRGAFLRVVNIAEENGRADELLENMKGCAHNFPLVEKWVEEFISQIKDEELKILSQQFWKEKKEKFEKEGFSYANLFGFA